MTGEGTPPRRQWVPIISCPNPSLRTAPAALPPTSSAPFLFSHSHSITFPAMFQSTTNHIGDTPATARPQNADMNPRVAVLGGPDVPARRAAHVMASGETVILHASLQQHIVARPRAARIPDTGERVLHPVCSRDCCSCELLHYLEGQHNAR